MLVPRNLSAIETHADRESSRYALGAIKLERADGRCHAVATDGRRLIAIDFVERAEPSPLHNGPVDAFETLLPLGALAAADKATKLTARQIASAPELDCIGISEAPAAEPGKPAQRITVQSSNGASTTRAEVLPVDGRFPRWRDVFPAHNVATQFVSLDPRFVIDACKALSALTTSEDNRGLIFAISGPVKPVVIYGRSVHADIRGRAVVMPLAIEDSKEKRESAAQLERRGVKVSPDHVAKGRDVDALIELIERAIHAGDDSLADVTAQAVERLNGIIGYYRAWHAERYAKAMADQAAKRELAAQVEREAADRVAAELADLAELQALTAAAVPDSTERDLAEIGDDSTADNSADDYTPSEAQAPAFRELVEIAF